MAVLGSLENFHLKMKTEKSNAHLALTQKSKAMDTLPPLLLLERLDSLAGCTGILGPHIGP